MSHPVAFITGASSGIGLALTKHLLSKDWHVVLADINPPPPSAALPTDTTIFIPCDVSSWDQQADAFRTAFAWHHRLDFAALNAGIAEPDDTFHSLSSSADHSPSKPNTKTFEVDLLGVYYGIKLFVHYASLNQPPAAPGGKIVITASSAGLYAMPGIPQYTAAKHGLVGLTRALAPKAAEHNITINAICPAMVRTGLAPPELLDAYPEKYITPMSTIMRAYDELMDEERRANGQVVEASQGELYYREQYKPLHTAKESQEYLVKALSGNI